VCKTVGKLKRTSYHRNRCREKKKRKIDVRGKKKGDSVFKELRKQSAVVGREKQEKKKPNSCGGKKVQMERRLRSTAGRVKGTRLA